MTTEVKRGRGYALAGSAAMLLAMSFGAGQVLSASNAASKQAAFDENPITGVTLPADSPTTAPVAAATASGHSATTAVAPTTTPAPPKTVVAGVCTYVSKIVVGGLPGPLGVGPADQLQVAVTKASWAGHMVSYQVQYEMPARLRLVSIAMPVAALADQNGTAHFIIPIGPESQGGAVSILGQVGSATDDVCDWHDVAVDYNGPQGLVGGITASLAKNLSGAVGGLLR